jgi:hypothetical protein
VSLAHRDLDWTDFRDRARRAFEVWNAAEGADRG